MNHHKPKRSPVKSDGREGSRAEVQKPDQNSLVGVQGMQFNCFLLNRASLALGGLLTVVISQSWAFLKKENKKDDNSTRHANETEKSPQLGVIFAVKI